MLTRFPVFLVLCYVSADMLTTVKDTAESITEVIGVSKEISTLFVGIFGEKVAEAIMSNDWNVAAVAVGAVGYSDFISWMDTERCGHIKQKYLHLQRECTEIYDKAVDLKKKATVLIGVGRKCASPDRPAKCTPEFFSGSNGFCPALLSVTKRFPKLLSTIEAHKKKVEKTEDKVGDLGDKHSKAALVGVGGSATMGAACCAATVAGPAIWAMCGIAGTGGIFGMISNLVTSNEFYHEQVELATLQLECGNYTRDIKKMQMYVDDKYKTLCSENIQAYGVPASDQVQLYEESVGHKHILGNFTVDPAVESMKQKAMVWLCISAASLCLTFVSIVWIQFRLHRFSVAFVDPEALLKDGE